MMRFVLPVFPRGTRSTRGTGASAPDHSPGLPAAPTPRGASAWTFCAAWMLACALGLAIAPTAGAQPAAIQADAAARPAPQLWTCGMHPQVIQDHPGDCPICHMKLTPLESEATQASGEGSTVRIDPVVVQNMGVRTARAVEGPVRREVRAAGFVEEAQPLMHDVSLRVSGWIRRLHADTEGAHVSKGDPLFELESPEVEVALAELLELRRRRDAGAGGLEPLWQAARRKLSRMGLEDDQIETLSRLEQPPPTVTLRSPVDGEVTEKPVVEGSAVAAGEKVLRIVDHRKVWIDARVYEQDLALVSIGQKVEATVAARADRTWEGEVAFVHPHLDETTRTASVRLSVDNPGLELRPGMFASVKLRAELAPRATLVPREAVIDTGDRQVAFVVGKEPGHFEPRRVRTGWAAEGGNVQVLEGLSPGDEVVVSGQFLLDTESRLQDALRKFLAPRGTGAAATRNGPGAAAPALPPGAPASKGAAGASTDAPATPTGATGTPGAPAGTPASAGSTPR